MIRESTIGELITALIDYRGKTPPKTTSGIPLITAKVIKEGVILAEPREYIAEDNYDAWMRRGRPASGDILITTEAPLGEVARVGVDARIALAQRVILLRPDPRKVDPSFMFHYLRSPQAQAALRRRSSGTTVSGIRQPELRALEVPLIERPAQEAIGAFLDRIDDLIENNRRRVEVLEDMARAIYREWFVKFRYPGHSDVSMVDSTLGPIPEGWQVGRVDSLILLQRGFDLPLKVRESGPIPVVGASGVQGSHLAAKATGPGVVTGRSGTIGVVNYVPGDFWPLNTSLWVREFRLATPRYAYFLLEGLDLKRAASGSAVPSLDRKVVHGLPVVCPPPNLIEGWDTRVAGMFEAVEALRSQSTRLSAIRDLLLPKLVTGQIDVSTLDLDALVSTGSTGESAVAP